MRLLLFLLLCVASQAQTYVPVREVPPIVPREFRAAWSACVYNIDWPSRKGLAPAAQRAELVRMLDTMQRLNMNALIFQVRPNADSVYKSRIEPWSSWLTGTMGRSPGYDPLDFCIKEAHARGIEVHAWFNPFRALPNASMPAARNHISRTQPSVMRKFKTKLWADPSSSFTQRRALSVIMDVVKRYDVDGVHIDDYFYPYPDVAKDGRPKQIFPDGKSPKQRRRYVDAFVKKMYSSVKAAKPWVRVGISPFGIWRPGVPRGTTARIDSYYHLSADSRKWLNQGWCDYLSPQLYWRIESEQSFYKLLYWWRNQGKRPVWPGIATSRIKSKEDSTRTAGEIINQISLSRTIGKNWVGHCHWSVKSLLTNRGGIAGRLAESAYAEPALVPPMPWLSKTPPPSPQPVAKLAGAGVSVTWPVAPSARQYALQARFGETWKTVAILPRNRRGFTFNKRPQAIAVSSVDRFGTTSVPSVLGLR